MSTYTERLQTARQEIATEVSSLVHGGMGGGTLEVWASRCAKGDVAVDVEQATYTTSDGKRWEVSFTLSITDLDMFPAEDDDWDFGDEGDDA